MTVGRDMADLVEASEAVGAAIERRRIRQVIDDLPPLNTDEIVYRERVLEAIKPVTTSPAIAESDVSLPPADGARLRRLPEAAAARSTAMETSSTG